MRETKTQSLSCIIAGFGAFVGVNILVVCPLVTLMLICAPQKLECEGVADGVASIAISDAKLEDGSVNFCSSVELYDKGIGDSSIHIFEGRFPRAFDFSDLSFFIRCDTATNFMIGSVRKTVGCFYQTLFSDEIAAAYNIDGTNTLVGASNGFIKLPLKDGVCRLVSHQRPAWSTWSFSPRWIKNVYSEICVFFVSEILLIVFSLVIAFCRRQLLFAHLHLCQSFALAAIAVFFLFYIVPLQSYCSNATEFPFSAIQLTLDVLPYSILAVAGAGVGLIMVEPVFGRLIHFSVFAFLIYEYFEVGLLLCGAPPFTGDMSFYSSLELGYRDWLAITYVFLFVMVLYLKFKKHFSLMIVLLLIMFIASLLDLVAGRRFGGAEGSVSSRWDCGRFDVPHLVRYSGNKNVIVFVLDSMTSEVARDVLNKNEDIAKSFDGFTAFDKNLGAQYQTDVSTLNIFTGEYYRGNAKKTSVIKHMPRAIGKDSALRQYLESSYDVYGMLPTSVLGRCYVSRPEEIHADFIARPIVRAPLSWCAHGGPLASISVLALSVFRMTPVSFKPSIYNWICPIYGYAEEEYVYPYLRAAQVGYSKGTFLYCHTWGVHVPHDVCGDGAHRGEVSPSYMANYNHAKAVINELRKTLEAYKRKSVYDCSTIIVMADHGSHFSSDAKHLDSRKNALQPIAFPMLWVKPANSRGPIVFDDVTPTTHANLNKVLSELRNRDMSADEIATTLSSNQRIFISQTVDGYDQWIVAPDGSVKSFSHIVVQ